MEVDVAHLRSAIIARTAPPYAGHAAAIVPAPAVTPRARALGARAVPTFGITRRLLAGGTAPLVRGGPTRPRRQRSASAALGAGTAGERRRSRVGLTADGGLRSRVACS